MYPQVLNDGLKSAKENLKSAKEWIVGNPGEKKKEFTSPGSNLHLH